MCIIGYGDVGQFAEGLSGLMGYETLCYALYDNRPLVEAISKRLVEIYEVSIKKLLEFGTLTWNI